MDEVAFGRYRLQELIGEGGMGQVFRAHDTMIGRDVAIKVLPPEMGTLTGYRERFRREAQVAARLTEPHIIPIHDTGEIDGRMYLVMPIIEGIDVQTVLEREGPMHPARAVHVIRQLAAALNMAHRNGLVHRDIKPSNALITSDEHVYLIDFGIAHDAAATRITQTGTMVGTFSYMAPERFLAGTVDARADVYSLACVLHECLTGARPFTGDSMEQQIAGHLTMAPPRPSGFNPALAGFDEVVARGMAKQPNERYQTAAELAAAAHDALSGAHTPPPPPVPPQRQPPRPWLPGPTDPTMVANQQATLHRPMPLVGAAPEGPALSTGRSAYVLAGVVLVSLATAALLIPWRLRTLGLDEPASAINWLVVLGTIPGLVLLVIGRRRSRADLTIIGSALVTYGVGALLLRLDSNYVGFSIPPGLLVLLAIAGLILTLVSALSHPSRALARGFLLFGICILSMAFIDLLSLPFGWIVKPSGYLALGVATGAIVLSGSAATRRRAADSPQPASERTLNAGRFACVLAGAALLAVGVAGSLVPWARSYWALSSFGYTSRYSLGAGLIWSVIIGAVPGLLLLVLGRGQRHSDQTIAGCALVAAGLGTVLLHLIHVLLPPYFLAGAAVVGFLLFLIAVYPRPTRAVARGTALCGTGVLTMSIISLGYADRHIEYLPIGYIVIIAMMGLILIVAGLVARRNARQSA
jgi:predicted Ser/Thr protein kinase